MGEGEFDWVLLEKVDRCVGKFDLTEVQDAQWAGYVEYGGHPDKNPWGKKKGEGYMEYDKRDGEDGVDVYESCNFASSSAFYHSFAQVCVNTWTTSPELQKALAQAYAGLSTGGSFFHSQGSY